MKLVIGNKRYSSWSLRPWLLLKHFEIPFTEELILLDQPETKQKILQHSPSGRVPVLIDGAAVIWESLAIAEYLNEVFPEKKMWPWSRLDRAQARAIASEMHSGFSDLRRELSMRVHRRYKNFSISAASQRDIHRIKKIWDESLRRSGGPFLFGNFTIVDAMFAPVAFRFQTYGVESPYAEFLLTHPAMREWQASAEAEPWLAADHE